MKPRLLDLFCGALLLAAVAFALGVGASFAQPATPELRDAVKANQGHERTILELRSKVRRLVVERDRARRRVRRQYLAIGKQRRVFRSALRHSPIGNHWLESAFLCIHGFEGSWGAATGNGYYGGLQMDRSFMGTYGGEYMRLGLANAWPRSVQIAVAIEAYLSGRGFGPWPNTRKMCGL